MYGLFANFMNLPTVLSSLNSGPGILSVIPLKVDGLPFGFISGFLLIPSIYLGLWIVGGIYFFIKRLSSGLVANIALPLIVTLIFTYDIALLSSITPVEPANIRYFQYPGLLGAIYTITIHILIRRVSDRKKSKKRNKKTKISNGSGQKISNIDDKEKK